MFALIAAICSGHTNYDKVYDENDWSNLEGNIAAYDKSKTLAEQAAWEFINGLDNEHPMELTVINPSYVLGPILYDKQISTSGEIILKLMRRDMPGIPHFHMNLVDVRDVAQAHLLAMTHPDAAGKRFCCTADESWAQGIAQILNDNFADQGFPAATRQLPNFLVRLFALADPAARLIVDLLGIQIKLSNHRIKTVLNWQPRSKDAMIIDMAESMIRLGVLS